MEFRERSAVSKEAIAASAAAQRLARADSPRTAKPVRNFLRAAPERTRPRAAEVTPKQPREGTSAQKTVNAVSFERKGVTAHSVRVGPKVVTIKVAKSAGVLVGDSNRQLNSYKYKLDRPRVSLGHLLEGHPDRMRSLAKLAGNPRSWMANYAFRRKLSAGPERPSGRVLFSGPSHGTARISARVDEYGAMVVENSRGVTVGDHGTQRNDFSYRTIGQEIPLEQMLRDRPDLVRTLAMAVRYPGNPAVQRTFTRQVSRRYVRGSELSLQVLNQNWASPSLSVEHAAGVAVGTGNIQKNTVSLELGRLVMTGWDSSVKEVAAQIHPSAPAVEPVSRVDPAIRPAPTVEPVSRVDPAIRASTPHIGLF